MHAARDVLRRQASTSVPGNYRQLVARKLVASVNWKIHKVRVSRPYRQWMGLIQGGMRSIVCAEVYRDTLFGPGGRDIWLFTFQDGRVDWAGAVGGAVYTVGCAPEFVIEMPKSR
jgi:hypothetical protein